MENLRTYGKKPFKVAVVHGGPGAPGAMAPVARELASRFGILEPLQTKNSVGGQVQELQDVLVGNADLPVILVGHSWGAWLSFMVTAIYPSLVKKLILVGSGAFEQKYAENIVSDRLNRMSVEERIEAFKLIDAINSPTAVDRDKTMSRLGELFTRADSYDPLPHEKDEALEFSYDINSKVWAEAERLRISGELLGMGKQIKCPVVAIHGDYDPHLAEGIREPLSRVLTDFRFILLEKCGHEPWFEKYARYRFYEVLTDELQ